MSVSHQTRGAAFKLRRTEHGGDDEFHFHSQKALAIALFKCCSSVRSTGTSVLKVFGGDSTFLQLQVQNSIQTSHSKWGAVWSLRCESWVGLEAFSPSGRSLNLRGLLEQGQSLEPKGARYARPGGVYCGYGPVPHLRKRRGGGGYFRVIHTTSEHRMNDLVVMEDGEVPVRVARTGPSLPNSWDDIAFGRRSRGWKSQRKSQKAWMR